VSVPGDAARLAVGTLTVLPVPPPRTVSPRVAGLAMALAPAAVLPLAAGAAVLSWAGQVVAAPSLLTAVLVLALLALGTGGLHLDGLADTADGLGVPGGVERRLEVMRRGDVGPLGASALVLVLATEAAALAGLHERLAAVDAALVVGLGVLVSRGCLALACGRGVPAARGDGLGSGVAGSVPWPWALASIGSLASLGWVLLGVAGPVAVAVSVAATLVVVARARARLGGVTGDVLGAGVEVSLAAFLAAVAVAA
jgi:adenosylcobinamide-GDP ribazoletransferase